ncbi:DNA helicase, partial [Tanacetum coccineum]
DSKTWQPRRRKGQGSIGRLVYVHPNSGELFYLRILLCHQKGCTSFEDIRTVNGRIYETFRAACDALGLLGDDKEWDIAGSLLAETDLIIWDESPMNDRRCFETLDRTLKDIMDRPDQLFGGKSVILGGDFRQTLPVKKGASKLEIVASSIAESQL